MYNTEEVNKLTDGGKSLADLVALEVGNIGENMQLQRGAVVKTADEMHLGSYIHTVGEFCFQRLFCDNKVIN